MTAGGGAPALDAEPRRARRLAAGLVTTVVIASFETTATTTILPVALTDLRAESFYGLAFCGFFVAQLAALPLSGWVCTVRGPVPAFVAGGVIHTVGLTLCGMASSVDWLLAGRVLQGAGGGLVRVAVFVLIAHCYTDGARGRLLGTLSMAWVLPGFLGPIAAASLVQVGGWRAAVLPIAVVAMVVLLVLLPTLTGLAGPARRRPRTSLARLMGPTFGLAAGVAVIMTQQDVPLATSWPLHVGATVAIVLGVRPLVPAGSFSLRAGLPATIVLRGLVCGPWMGAAFLIPLALLNDGARSVAEAGAAMSAGIVGYAIGGLVHRQYHVVPTRRALLTASGALLATAGFCAVAVEVSMSVPVAVVYVSWASTGLGISLAATALNLEILRLSPPDEQGSTNAAMTVVEAVVVSMVTVGATLALGQWPAGTVTAPVTVVLAACAAVLFAVAAIQFHTHRRTRQCTRSPRRAVVAANDEHGVEGGPQCRS